MGVSGILDAGAGAQDRSWINAAFSRAASRERKGGSAQWVRNHRRTVNIVVHPRKGSRESL